MSGDQHPCPRCGIVRSAFKRKDRSMLCKDCARQPRVTETIRWGDYAACSPSPAIDPDWWWPVKEDPQVTILPLSICHRVCKVRDLCLDYALNRPETEGIWGGLLPSERRGILARRRKAG